MAPTRARKPSTRSSSTVFALLLAILASATRGCGGHPLTGAELDTAVDGVQRYLESSGFPKMTRGEVVQFLDDFSRTSRSALQKTAAAVESSSSSSAPSPRPDVARPKTRTAADVPDAESPLNYGYPLSMKDNYYKRSEPSSTAESMIFVTVPPAVAAASGRDRGGAAADGRVARRMQAGAAIPASDPNAYAAFKRIPDAKNYSGMDAGMRTFLDGFGLLRSRDARTAPAAEGPRRRSDVLRDDDADEKRLLDAVLTETGAVDANGTAAAAGTASVSKSDHVFNPRAAAHVKTVDVNRIAKIVENIRLLADDNGTASLPREAIQEKLENITAAIGAIDRPADAVAGARPPSDAFDGYEVFFDDSGTKELDSDLPADSPASDGTLTQALNPPDPLSVDELQQLLEKHKSDVKRQQPETVTTTAAASAVDPDAVSTSSEAAQTTARLLEATSFKDATSTEEPKAAAVDDASTTAAAATAAVESNSPSLSQLAESFGGGETASSAPAPEDLSTTAAPNRPKNGLYFYVDWNSFLTVNSGQRNQVNLRFAPKAGNPAHFIKVTVP